MKVVMPPLRMAGPMSVRAAAVRFSLLEAREVSLMMSAKGEEEIQGGTSGWLKPRSSGGWWAATVATCCPIAQIGWRNRRN